MFAAQSMYSFRKLLETFLFQRAYILNLTCVLTLSGVLVAFFAYIALNLSFLYYITLHKQRDGCVWKKRCAWPQLAAHVLSLTVYTANICRGWACFFLSWAAMYENKIVPRRCHVGHTVPFKILLWQHQKIRNNRCQFVMLNLLVTW